MKYLKNYFQQVEEETIGQSDKRKGRTGWPHHVWALELKQ